MRCSVAYPNSCLRDERLSRSNPEFLHHNARQVLNGHRTWCICPLALMHITKTTRPNEMCTGHDEFRPVESLSFRLLDPPALTRCLVQVQSRVFSCLSFCRTLPSRRVGSIVSEVA